MAFDASQCTIQISSEPHSEYPDGLVDVSATVSHPTREGSIALAQAVLIRRSKLDDELHLALDEESQELGELASTLFDEQGRLHSWLVEPGSHRAGTGVWGRELNEGALLYISDVTVNESHRAKGVGSWMLQKLLQCSHIGLDDFVLAWPATGPGGPQNEVEEERIITFFRKNGFRRLGRTQFFMYSPKPNHPSRQLSARDDANKHAPPPAVATALSTLSAEASTELRSITTPTGYTVSYMHDTRPDKEREAYRMRFPLHAAIADSLAQSDVDGAAALRIRIINAHAEDSQSISQPGLDGELPIHIAARAGSITSTSALLECGIATHGDLENRQTMAGLSPLELCDATILRERKFGVRDLGGILNPPGSSLPRPYTHEWTGAPRNLLLVQKALRIAMGQTIPESDEEYIGKRKFGCTCGECAGGWLSYRMRYHLHVRANTLAIALGDFESDAHRRPLDEWEIPSELDFIPRRVRQQVYKTFVRGFGAMFRLVQAALDHPRISEFYKDERLPLNDPLLAMHQELGIVAPPRLFPLAGLVGPQLEYRSAQALRSYTDKCGGAPLALLYALDCVTHEASAWPPRDTDEEYNTEEWDALLNCANDDAFDFVRQKLGLSPNVEWGPYRERYRSDEDEDEGDEDSFSD